MVGPQAELSSSVPLIIFAQYGIFPCAPPIQLSFPLSFSPGGKHLVFADSKQALPFSGSLESCYLRTMFFLQPNHPTTSTSTALVQVSILSPSANLSSGLLPPPLLFHSLFLTCKKSEFLKYRSDQVPPLFQVIQ